MASKKPCDKVNFMYSFRPIYCFCRGCGAMPFSITHNLNGVPYKPKITKFDLLWLAISIFVYLFDIYLIIRNMKLHKSVTSASYNLIDDSIFILRIFALIFGLFAIAMDTWNRFELIKILKMFIISDIKVN